MKKKALTTVLIVFVFLVLASPVMAQVIDIWEGTDCNQRDAEPCEFCDALIVANNIINSITKVAFALAALFITVGAVMIALGGTSQNTFERGKKTLTSAIVGLFITLGAWVIVNTVIRILSPEGSIFPWAELTC